MERIRFLIPNLLTLIVSLSGLALLGVAYFHRTRDAAYFVILCIVADALDGYTARRLNAQTRFGNIFDSMSDFLAFGIAPSLSMVFLDLLHPAVAAFYILAIQFRLTRYSARPEDEVQGAFFQGLSSPDATYIGMALGLLPYSSFNIGYGVAGLLAVYPGKLSPRGYIPVKAAIGLTALYFFVTG